MKKTIGEQAQEFRVARGWSTGDMARAVGTNRQSIENLEAVGDRRPRYIDRLANVMGVTVDDLLAGRYKFDKANPLHTAPMPAPKAPEAISPLAVALGALFDEVASPVDRAIAYGAASAAILQVIRERDAAPKPAPVEAPNPEKKHV